MLYDRLKSFVTGDEQLGLDLMYNSVNLSIIAGEFY